MRGWNHGDSTLLSSLENSIIKYIISSYHFSTSIKSNFHHSACECCNSRVTFKPFFKRYRFDYHVPLQPTGIPCLPYTPESRCESRNFIHAITTINLSLDSGVKCSHVTNGSWRSVFYPAICNV